LLIALVALALRVLYVVFVRPHTTFASPDAILYHDGANLLAKGHGFIDPYDFRQGIVSPEAAHPPLYLLYLAVFSFFGFTSLLAHMLASTLLGAATVFVVGLLGHDVGGPQVGFVAAAIAAVYPGLIAIDGAVQSESLAVLVVTGLVLLLLRYGRAPSLRGAVTIGLVAGVAALVRPEQLLLLPLVIVPLVLRSAESRRAAVERAAALCAVVVIAVAPWVAFNLSRFDRPVYFSTNFDYTIAATNCHATYYGTRIGYWSGQCGADATEKSGERVPREESRRGVLYRRAGLRYMRTHAARLPAVMGARVLRLGGLWNPVEEARLQRDVEGRETWMAAGVIVAFWALGLLALRGAFVLRRRGQSWVEMTGPFFVAVVTAVVFMGNSRYRSSAEGTLAVLAAVAVVARGRTEARTETR
jgi:4-amino-4-deoxy-L-arabinose transferase-like glycosyltransferase